MFELITFVFIELRQYVCVSNERLEFTVTNIDKVFHAQISDINTPGQLDSTTVRIRFGFRENGFFNCSIRYPSGLGWIE